MFRISLSRRGTLVDDASAEGASNMRLSLFRFNRPLLVGAVLLLTIMLGCLAGYLVWDIDLAFTGRAPLNLPPVGFTNLRGQAGMWAHPLGTDNSGRDMLALLIVAIPNSLLIGALAAGIGVGVGILFGFTAGYSGGIIDDLIRLASDILITVPILLVLIVIQATVRQVEVAGVAAMIAAFAWARPTRQIRAQVLSMRESGYVKLAALTGVPVWRVMLGEMLPNLLPYLLANFIAAMSGAILAAVGLEILGLGPQRTPTLGRMIYQALENAALIRNMWWWWGLPTLVLIITFVSLMLVNLGFDKLANPRLRDE